MSFNPNEQLKNPDWANNDELKALNEQIDAMSGKLNSIENLLRSMNANIAVIADKEV
tara:strand:+ start:323 stop:493 length:171 start_codon:yes stop_codon:yes gene_type:complete